MSAQPKVSVVIPVYNRQSLITRAVDSVLAQSYENYELIVVDDGSTDDTRRCLEQYGERVHVLHQRNRGPYPARNLALEHARGEYVAFLDSDDVWHSTRLAKQVPLLERDSTTALVYGNGNLERGGKSLGTFFTSLNEPRRGWVFKDLVAQNFIPQSSVLVRRACFTETGPFWELPLSADYHKWLQVAQRHRVDYVDDVVFTYHLHDNNLVRDRISQHRNDIRIYRRFLAEAADADTAGMLAGRIVETEYVLALVYCREGAAQLARTLFSSQPHSSLPRRLATLLGVVARRAQRVVRKAFTRQ